MFKAFANLFRKRFYHLSATKLEIGTKLVPNKYSVVCLSDSPYPHCTIAPMAHEENWFIYEVSPLGEIGYGHEYKELICFAAVVKRQLGRVSKFSKKKESKVRQKDHPSLKIYYNREAFGCRNTVDLLVKEAFEGWDGVTKYNVDSGVHLDFYVLDYLDGAIQACQGQLLRSHNNIICGKAMNEMNLVPTEDQKAEWEKRHGIEVLEEKAFYMLERGHKRYAQELYLEAETLRAVSL